MRKTLQSLLRLFPVLLVAIAAGVLFKFAWKFWQSNHSWSAIFLLMGLFIIFEISRKIWGVVFHDWWVAMRKHWRRKDEPGWRKSK